MKTKVLLLSLFAAVSAQAASTLSFGTSSVIAGNWASATGDTAAKMLWGILIDTTGNGFGSGSYLPGFTYTAGLQTLSTSGGVSDDVLFIGSSGNLMTLTTNTNDGGAIGINRIGAIASVPYTNGVSVGDTFAIVWFNQVATGGTSVGNEKYGVFSNAAFTMPSDGTANQPYTTVFEGPDSTKTMAFSLVPEASTALLGALGALGLLRRRR